MKSPFLATDDPLARVLRRAKQAILKAELLKQRAKAALDAECVAEDYARRLAERAHFRVLLANDLLDGARFRWYFEKIENEIPLDQLRAWIDGRMSGASSS